MTRTLGLELIENILKSYPGVFFRVCYAYCLAILKFFFQPTALGTLGKSAYGYIFQHPEFCELLKTEVCPLVIKLFSPSLKSAHVRSFSLLAKPILLSFSEWGTHLSPRIYSEEVLHTQEIFRFRLNIRRRDHLQISARQLTGHIFLLQCALSE